MRRIAELVALLLLAAVPAAAQAISAGVEVRRDRLDYHFDNPSTFDTTALVPHFFEQRYDADNLWLVVRARYGGRWTTTAGVTPRRGTTADDYDTFLDPGGPTWVSGTTGPADVRSFSIEQRARIAGRTKLTVDVGYRLRVDRFDFGPGLKTVTRDGALVSSAEVTGPETTSSVMQQFFGAAGFAIPVGTRWTLTADGEAAPFVVGRLSVRLPDKYPGQDLVFVAHAFGAAGRVSLARPIGR